MESVAIELLSIESVRANAAAVDNLALRSACWNKMESVTLKLLELDQVKTTIKYKYLKQFLLW